MTPLLRLSCRVITASRTEISCISNVRSLSKLGLSVLFPLNLFTVSKTDPPASPFRIPAPRCPTGFSFLMTSSSYVPSAYSICVAQGAANMKAFGFFCLQVHSSSRQICLAPWLHSIRPALPKHHQWADRPHKYEASMSTGHAKLLVRVQTSQLDTQILKKSDYKSKFLRISSSHNHLLQATDFSFIPQNLWVWRAQLWRLEEYWASPHIISDYEQRKIYTDPKPLLTGCWAHTSLQNQIKAGSNTFLWIPKFGAHEI